MVDTEASKAFARKGVRVRVPPRVPLLPNIARERYRTEDEPSLCTLKAAKEGVACSFSSDGRCRAMSREDSQRVGERENSFLHGMDHRLH